MQSLSIEKREMIAGKVTDILRELLVVSRKIREGKNASIPLEDIKYNKGKKYRSEPESLSIWAAFKKRNYAYGVVLTDEEIDKLLQVVTCGITDGEWNESFVKCAHKFMKFAFYEAKELADDDIAFDNKFEVFGRLLNETPYNGVEPSISAKFGYENTHNVKYGKDILLYVENCAGEPMLIVDRKGKIADFPENGMGYYLPDEWTFFSDGKTHTLERKEYSVQQNIDEYLQMNDMLGKIKPVYTVKDIRDIISNLNKRIGNREYGM